MDKLRTLLFFVILAFLALNSPINAWTDGRVVVLGTEFFWYNPITGTPEPLRLVGYSDYDLLTATTVDWEGGGLCSHTGIRNRDKKIGGFQLVVDPGLYDDVLQKLRWNDVTQTPRDVNLLRIWANGKHNARDWQREGGVGGHPAVKADDLRNEHDLQAFQISGPPEEKYNIVAELDPVGYVPRLQELCRLAMERNTVVMITIFDNITLSMNDERSKNRYGWGTSPWFYGNEAGATLRFALPDDGFGTDGYGSSSGDAYPQWYFDCLIDQPPSCDFESGSPMLTLVTAQWHFMQQLVKAVSYPTYYGNVIFEIMNEPAPKATTQADNMLWHEIMGLLLHSLDPTRVVVAQPTLQPDAGGSFRIGTNGCRDFSFPECQPVGINSVGHALLDLPDLDAISLHHDQWGVNDTNVDHTTAKMENVLDRTPPPGQERLFTTNIKPVIVDTDGAITPDNSDCGEPTPSCSDPRKVNLNDKLGSFADKAIDLGASFNHKDGIGTTELSGTDKCGIGDARFALTLGNLDSRIDDVALTQLNEAQERFDPTVDFSQNHEPDYAVVDLRYDDACVDLGDFQNCIETYDANHAAVPFKISLGRLSTVAPAHLELQYRWLRAAPSTSRILSVWEPIPGQPFPWTYITDTSLPTAPSYVMDVPYQTPPIPSTC
jgi:hypothetical protein